LSQPTAMPASRHNRLPCAHLGWSYWERRERGEPKEDGRRWRGHGGGWVEYSPAPL
jgi:hypothetical protein